MGGFSSWLSQIAAVTWLNLRNLPQRLGASAATVVGVAGVVMVMIGVLSMAVGFESTLASTGRDDAVVVLRDGATSELSSGFGLEESRIIADAPGVRSGADGPLASAELFVIVDVPKRSTGTDVNVPMRGVQPSAFAVRKEFTITEGRNFEPGRSEVIVGDAAALEFSGLEVGTVRRWGENEWTVVGHFSTGGTVEDSEVWADVKVLQPAYRRGNSFQSVRVLLESADAFTPVQGRADHRPQGARRRHPRVGVLRRAIAPDDQHHPRPRLLHRSADGDRRRVRRAQHHVHGGLRAHARDRDAARARLRSEPGGGVGDGESLLLAGLGAVVGAGIAYALFNGYQAATMNFQTFSQVAFAFAVTPALLTQGAIFALVMGSLGGFFPALRAARQPVAAALRQI